MKLRLLECNHKNSYFRVMELTKHLDTITNTILTGLAMIAALRSKTCLI